MKFDLTNEDIVFLYKHFEMYRDMITDKVMKEFKLKSGQLKLYKDVFGDSEEFDAEEFALNDRLINYAMPKNIEIKQKFLNILLEKLLPYFELINESEPDLVSNIVEEQFEESKEVKDIIEQLKKKIKDNGRED